PLEKKLKLFATKLKVDTQAFFLGERNDVPKLLKQMDVFVVSSLKEGFPYVILEAMAAGLPIISTKVGGIPEILSFESPAIKLVPAKDSQALTDNIKIFLENINKVSAAAKTFPEIVDKQFTEKQMVEKIEQLYNSLKLKQPRT
ncbi:MAG: glycosyltransferase, partial [Candidatus Margulisbacteria bacterium]|nr:glycosyltransferase [Candidatus Margulisiibacteriota bacterium]